MALSDSYLKNIGLSHASPKEGKDANPLSLELDPVAQNGVWILH
jgi:hypothetical protein